MGGEGFVKFLRKGPQLDRVANLHSDAMRWRWWLLYGLSEQEVFPGLVAEGLDPLDEAEIVKEVYAGAVECKESEKLLLWKQEKAEMLRVGLIKSTYVDGNEFLWNVDYHVLQDRFSKKGATSKDRYYSSFLKLNDRERCLFLVLLSSFAPLGIELEVFSIPRYSDQFESFAGGRLPLFDTVRPEGGMNGMKALIVKVTDDVQRFVLERKKGTKSETQEFVQWYCEKFKLRVKKPYAVGGKDFKLVSEMLKLFSATELQTMAERFFREDDAYAKKAGYTIGVFKCCLNRLVSTKPRRSIGAEDYNRPVSM
jgi:hypothetical protein